MNGTKFDADGLEGMEAFHDDVAMHIIKYEHGEGFHWIIRSWDAAGHCHVTGSYDYQETEIGLDFLSDAYRSLMAYIAENNILPHCLAEQESSPSAVRKFLHKALLTGFAAMLSLTAIVSPLTPTIAYADDAASANVDIIVEAIDGQVGVYHISHRHRRQFPGSRPISIAFQRNRTGQQQRRAHPGSRRRSAWRRRGNSMRAG